MTPYPLTSGETWLCPPWAILPPDRIDTRTCRSCGVRFTWLKTIKTGSLAPVNADGTSHFSDCPDARDWRKQRREEAAL